MMDGLRLYMWVYMYIVCVLCSFTDIYILMHCEDFMVLAVIDACLYGQSPY